MRRFRFRALVTLDPPTRGAPGMEYTSRTRELLVHARRIGQPSADRYFSAVICEDQGRPLRTGERAVVTITVVDDDAPAYLASGQPFTIWGSRAGRGIISRRVFTDSGPS